MRGFPDRASVEALADIGVRYIVIQTDLYPPGEWAEAEKRLPDVAAWLTLQHTAGAGGCIRCTVPQDGAASGR